MIKRCEQISNMNATFIKKNDPSIIKKKQKLERKWKSQDVPRMPNWMRSYFLNSRACPICLETKKECDCFQV